VLSLSTFDCASESVESLSAGRRHSSFSYGGRLIKRLSAGLSMAQHYCTLTLYSRWKLPYSPPGMSTRSARCAYGAVFHNAFPVVSPSHLSKGFLLSN